MTSPTHITFAELVYLLILTTTGVSLSIIHASVIAVSSILPDIDTAASTAGKLVPFVARRIERRFGHRTLTHSIPFMIGLAIFAAPLYVVNSSLYVCFLVGYSTHPFLDTMTVNGVKLFYPFSGVRCVFPFEVNNPHRYRITTGSKSERVLSVIFLLGCIPTFLVSYEGYERFVRSTQQNIEAAVRDYNTLSGEYLVVARIVAHSSLTKEMLRDTVEIIGATGPHTLVFKSRDSRLHTLGKEFQADFVADNILCARGTPASSSIRNIDVSNQLLLQVASYVDSSSENYFFGDLTTTDKVSLPENIRIFTPVTGSGGLIKLNFATYDDIRNFNLENIFVTRGILTIKSVKTGSDGGAHGKSETLLPKLENYEQLSVSLLAKESMVFAKQQGDSVREHELLAQKDVAQLYEEEIALNSEKISALEEDRISAASALDEKISLAAQALHIDSVEYCQNIELAGHHYLPVAMLATSRIKWKKGVQLLSALRLSKVSRAVRANIEIHKLKIGNEELASKSGTARLQSEIRSPVNGILVAVRQTPHDNKTLVTFILRKGRP